MNTLTSQDEKKIVLADQSWTDTFAKKIVLADFDSAETDRTSNHDHRWQTAMELYLAYQQTKTWEGTRIPRANIPIYLTFKQIESLMPRYMRIFADDPWADVEPDKNTKLQDALDGRDFVLDQWRQAKGKAACRRAFKSKLIFGNGICEVGWKYCKEKRLRFEPNWTRKMKKVFHPLLGWQQIPGDWVRKVKEVEEEEVTDRPFIEYVSLKDFYQDPNTESPMCQDGKFSIRRKLMTIQELMEYDGYEGFTIPDGLTLLELAAKKTMSNGDSAKQAAEATRGIQWFPRQDTSSDPSQARLEVLRYCTKDRWVWLLERDLPIYNAPNDYEIAPFFNTVYTDVLDRFYGLAVTDVVEGDQRVVRAFTEARIDEISLSIHAARIKKRGVMTKQSDFRRRPGQVIETDNPKEDVVTEQVQNISQPLYLEANIAEMRSQGTTAVSDVAVAGGPTAGGNSANRTATGVQAQSSAAGERHVYLVEIDEDDFVEPMLNLFLKLDQRYINPIDRQALGFQKPDQTYGQMDSLSLLNAGMRFNLRAGARARARMGDQESLGLITQTFLNPNLIAQLNKMGMTPDFEQIAYMALDKADYKARGSFLRKLTPEEQKQLSAPPAEAQLKMQMQQARLTAQGTVDDKTEYLKLAELLKDVVKSVLTEHTKPAA